MIRLMLNSYNSREREQLAYHLEAAQRVVALNAKCDPYRSDCRDCDNRHLCTDLLAAAVFAKDFKPAQN